MFLFKTVIGRVIEVRRFINGPSRWARWGNWRERHEFPARRGHPVVALVRRGQ